MAREPLGILDAWMLAREPRSSDGQRLGPKGSLRWVEGYERLAELAPTRLVYIADREADMMPLMARAQELACPWAGWCVLRTIAACPTATSCGRMPRKGSRSERSNFALAARRGAKARIVRQQLWVRHVELRAGKNKTVSATCMVAREVGAPAGVKPIEWRLRTNRGATTRRR